mgnify:CR=1 FL=1
MATEIPQQVIDLINDENTIKVLSTVNEQGHPYSVAKWFMRVSEQGYLTYLELLESSRSYSNPMQVV